MVPQQKGRAMQGTGAEGDMLHILLPAGTEACGHSRLYTASVWERAGSGTSSSSMGRRGPAGSLAQCCPLSGERLQQGLHGSKLQNHMAAAAGR